MQQSPEFLQRILEGGSGDQQTMVALELGQTLKRLQLGPKLF